MKRNCESCRCWSDQRARVRNRKIEAECLRQKSVWTTATDACQSHRYGQALDLPQDEFEKVAR